VGPNGESRRRRRTTRPRRRQGGRASREAISDADERRRTGAASTLSEPIHLHFLCNTLHVLQGLVHRDPDRVEQMLDELSELLHHLLHSTRVADVPLREEIAALRAYASLQKLRFEDRLDVGFEIDPATVDRRVPGFVLYPLIENAVKFGMHTGPLPARVRISIALVGERLHVAVANTGRWLEGEAEARPWRGHGMALTSVRQRLADTFGDAARLDIREEGGWVVVTVELPG
jgi:LytS/YehU family sensor histidine kinase